MGSGKKTGGALGKKRTMMISNKKGGKSLLYIFFGEGEVLLEVHTGGDDGCW